LVQGVCPQHDLLWESLTAREHLNFYARLKGLTGKPLVAAVDEALRNVKLFDVGNKRAGQFSGGGCQQHVSDLRQVTSFATDANGCPTAWVIAELAV
jgi:ABC-type multidrug transport system ATPase subunit